MTMRPHPRSSIITPPLIAYYTDEGLPIFTITIDNQLVHAYWWGINCWTIKTDPECVLEHWGQPYALPENRASLDEFWEGYTNGHESPIFRSLIKEPQK